MVRLATLEVHMMPWEASISRGLLESEDIPAFLETEHLVGAWWPMALGFGGVRLRVPETHVAPALAVLAQRDSGELQAELLAQQPFAPRVCTRCGGAQFRELRSLSFSLVMGLFMWITHATFPLPKREVCAACGGLESRET
jgi:hypothetical protein